MSLKQTIKKVLREDTNEFGERTKLEKLVAKQFSKINSQDLSNILLDPDNVYDVVVDVYTTEHGRRCHITVLMNDSFNGKDSDMLQRMMTNIKRKIKDMFSNLFDDGISSSVSTIESYKLYKWFYDKKKNQQ